MPHLLSTRAAKGRGFTLVELAVVVVIIGIILAMGTANWMMMLDARQLSKTRGTIRRANQCILRWVETSARYPDFDADFASNSEAVVNRCLREKRDAWGNFIHFVEGVSEGANFSLEASYGGNPGCIAPNPTAHANDPCNIANIVKPDQTSSVATDKSGNTVQRVAYVLVSFGDDATADDTSYGDLFGANVHGATMDVANPPDFTNSELAGVATRDDVYLIVTYEDILAAIAEGRI